MDDQKDQQANHAHAGNSQTGYTPVGHAPIINIKNEPISDDIEFENNPWNVESLQAFLYLKCPQCVFDTKEKDSFQNHAIENHPLSIVLFGKTLKEENTFDLGDPLLADKIDSENLQWEPDYLDYCESKLEEFDYEYTEHNYKTDKLIDSKSEVFTETKKQGHFFKDFLSVPLDTNVKGGDFLETARKKRVRGITSSISKSAKEIYEASLGLKGGDAAESEIVCDICNKRFISKKAFTLHVFQKHRDACNICFQNFESKQHLEAHITTAHTLTDFRKKYRCVICDVSFDKNTSRLEKPSQLIKHMMSEHIVGYKCPICKIKLPPNMTLKLHNSQEHKTIIPERWFSVGRFDYNGA